MAWAAVARGDRSGNTPVIAKMPIDVLKDKVLDDKDEEGASHSPHSAHSPHSSQSVIGSKGKHSPSHTYLFSSPLLMPSVASSAKPIASAPSALASASVAVEPIQPIQEKKQPDMDTLLKMLHQAIHVQQLDAEKKTFKLSATSREFVPSVSKQKTEMKEEKESSVYQMRMPFRQPLQHELCDAQHIKSRINFLKCYNEIIRGMRPSADLPVDKAIIDDMLYSLFCDIEEIQLRYDIISWLVFKKIVSNDDVLCHRDMLILIKNSLSEPKDTMLLNLNHKLSQFYINSAKKYFSDIGSKYAKLSKIYDEMFDKVRYFKNVTNIPSHMEAIGRFLQAVNIILSYDDNVRNKIPSMLTDEMIHDLLIAFKSKRVILGYIRDARL